MVISSFTLCRQALESSVALLCVGSGVVVAGHKKVLCHVGKCLSVLQCVTISGYITRGETISTGLHIDLHDVVGAIGADAIGALVHLSLPATRLPWVKVVRDLSKHCILQRC